MIDQPFDILLIFTGIISLALFLSEKYKIAQKISPILIILFFSALIANLGIIRTDNPFYLPKDGKLLVHILELT